MYMKIHLTVSVSRFTKSASRFTKPVSRLIVLTLRVTAAFTLYLLLRLKRHKRCPTKAITKFSKSVSRLKHEADFVKREPSLVNRETDTVKWIFIKHAVFTHGVLTNGTP